MGYTKEEFDKVLKYYNENPNYKAGPDLTLGVYEFTIDEINEKLTTLNYVTFENNRFKITDKGRHYLRGML